MLSLTLTFLAAFASSIVLTAVVRAAAQRWGIVDLPDGKRKLHARPVALLGGVAVYLALLLGLVVACWGSFGVGAELNELAAVLAAVAGVVCVFGAVDDGWCLRSRWKLALQVASVIPIVAFGYWFDRIVVFGHPVQLGLLGLPLTMIWLVGCINALNLLDGMDGLASTVGVLTALMMAVIGTQLGHPHIAPIAVALAGALAGFLIHNLPPARIFLGDSGSMVIGLVVGLLAMQGSMKTSTTVAMTVPVVLMTLPILDTLLAVVRRRLTGRRFDAADREHIHHRLLDRGMNPWQALAALGALCLLTGSAATASIVFGYDMVGWLTVLGVVVLAVRFRWFGHHELALARGALARRMADLARRLDTLPSDMGTTAATAREVSAFDEKWAALIEKAARRGAARVEWVVCRQGRSVRGVQWSVAALADDAVAWSIVVGFHRGDGLHSEVRASGLRPIPSAAATGEVAKLLQKFGVRFAECADDVPGLSVVAPGPDLDGDALDESQPRAA